MARKEDERMKKIMACAAAVVAGCLLALAPAPVLGADQTVEHTIRSGDDLHLIAGYYFGDPRQWRRIWKSNRKALAGPSRLVPGKTLRIVGAADDNLLGTYDEYRTRVRGN
jgi:nucleoid-associated protein YgaU